MIFFSFKKAWNTLFLKPKLLLLAAICDALFIFILGALSPFMDGLAYSLVIAILGVELAIKHSVILGAMILVVLAITYILTQATSWWAAQSMLKPHQWKRYLQNFAKLTIVPGILLLVLYVVDLALQLRKVIISTIAGLQANGIELVALIATILIFFWLIARYAAKSPTINLKKSLLLTIITIIAWLIIDFFIAQVLQWSPKIGFIISIVILLPLVTLTRLTWILEDVRA
jgi:hypothetical protein